MIPKITKINFKRLNCYEYLRSKIPEAIAQLGEKQFQVVFTCDNFDGDQCRMALYVLFRGNDRTAIKVEGPEGPEHIWVGSAFGLDSKGRIISEISIPESAAYCVVPWLPPSNFRGSVTIINKSSGARSTYEVRSNDIVTLM